MHNFRGVFWRMKFWLKAFEKQDFCRGLSHLSPTLKRVIKEFALFELGRHSKSQNYPFASLATKKNGEFCSTRIGSHWKTRNFTFVLVTVFFVISHTTFLISNGGIRQLEKFDTFSLFRVEIGANKTSVGCVIGMLGKWGKNTEKGTGIYVEIACSVITNWTAFSNQKVSMWTKMGMSLKFLMWFILTFVTILSMRDWKEIFRGPLHTSSKFDFSPR